MSCVQKNSVTLPSLLRRRTVYNGNALWAGESHAAEKARHDVRVHQRVKPRSAKVETEAQAKPVEAKPEKG